MEDLAHFLLCRTPHLYQKLLKWKGNYSLEKIIFLNLIKNGDIVFDIGANRGYYTLLYSHLVGRYGEVHAFEPVLPTFEKLSQHISHRQRFDNIYLNNTAIGDIEDTITLYMPDNDDGQASVRTHFSGSWNNPINITSYSCQMMRLDNYVASQPVKHLDFIKLDVEGAELLALRGATQTLSQYLPITYLEIFHDWIKDFDYCSSDLIELLTALGYSNFYLVSDHIHVLVDPIIKLDGGNLPQTANLLCTIPQLHKVKIENLLKL